MQFFFQPLTWGFLLIGVPILVHLINMLRHRKLSWAAMDFLLESYRKHRRWVLLKQWLLLAARMLAMLLLVAMLAGWISSSQSLSWFGGQVTHHYVLLDDSYSMAEQTQGETAYARGLKAVQSLIRSIAAQPGEHELTLLRWSRAELAARSDQDQARVDVAADLIAQTVPRDASRLLGRIVASQPTSLQLSPEPAVELVAPLISSLSGGQVEIYLVTDLRRNEWGQSETLKSRLAPLVRGSTHVQVVDCADNSDANANLSLVGLQPEQETWAAGVPLMVKFQVRNQGQLAVRNVVVKVRSLTYAEGSARPASDLPYSGEAVDAPPVVIEEIAPGETVTRQVQMLFGVPGPHVVEASLPDDRLSADNKRWCVIGIRQSQQVLVVDGSADPNAAFFLKTALQPGGVQPTGMSVEIRDTTYLRDVTPEALAAWDAIVLMEVPRMDPQAVSHLEQYVNGGGGLAVFAGPNTNLGVINEQFYRDGQGLFPAAVTDILETSVAAGTTEPQVTATDHPIFAPLKNMSTSPFQLVEIRRMLGLGKVDDKEKGNIDVVALGPDGRPLILDKGFGNGHVVAVLTGLTSQWSTWPQDPTFVVMSMRMMGYLGSFRRAPTSQPVGSPIVGTFHQALLPNTEILLPAKGENVRAKLEFQSEAAAPDQPTSVRLAIDLGKQDNDAIEGLLRPGVFEIWMQNVNGEYLVRNVAHNVPSGEGNLARVTRSELEEKLRPIKITIQSAESLSNAGWTPEAASFSSLLLGLLTVLLLVEQALAYSASYHVPRIARAGAAS